MSHAADMDAATRRLLKRLSTPGAWLAASEQPSGERPPGYHVMPPRPGLPALPAPAPVVAAAHRRQWLSHTEGRYTLTRAGALALRRALSAGEAAGAIPARPTASSRKAEAAPLLNEAESPLGWLRRRRDASGRPMIDDEQFAAGERLRADVFFAGLSPRVTANWSGVPASSSERRAAPGGNMLDTTVAARQRVRRAVVAVGPELSGLLLDICGFLKGLEDVERDRGWPPRTAKVVLLLALTALARHYGLVKDRAAQPHPGARPKSAPPSRHWGTPDYRPGLAVWDE